MEVDVEIEWRVNLLTSHSKLIKELIGDEKDKDEIKEFLKILYYGFNEKRLISLLDGIYECKKEEIEDIWNFLYQYAFDIKDNFRYYCIGLFDFTL
jgi:hypothetical protein